MENGSHILKFQEDEVRSRRQGKCYVVGKRDMEALLTKMQLCTEDY